MKLLSIAGILTAVDLGIVPTFAADDDDYIFGRSEASVESTLRDRGVITADLEEWGDLIRAWVPDGNGGTQMQLLDPNTLELVLPSRG